MTVSARRITTARGVYRRALCHLIQRAAQEVLTQDDAGEPGDELVGTWTEVRDARIELRTALLDGAGA